LSFLHYEPAIILITAQDIYQEAAWKTSGYRPTGYLYGCRNNSQCVWLWHRIFIQSLYQ